MMRHRGYLTGYAGQALEGRDKARFAEKVCAERNVALAHAAAIGDSRSDVPIFKRVGYSIALNGDAQAKAVASVTRETDDLRDLLCLLTPELNERVGAQHATSIGLATTAVPPQQDSSRSFTPDATFAPRTSKSSSGTLRASDSSRVSGFLG